METITGKKVDLIKWLCGEEMIFQHVHSMNLITLDEYMKVKSFQDPNKKITELLDIILLKGDSVCINFLELLKKDDVIKSRPQLNDWISTVNTSALAVKKENRNTAQAGNAEIPEIEAAPQSSVTSSGRSVNINASGGSYICSPVIIGSNISGLNMNNSIGSQKRNDVEPQKSPERTLNNKTRPTDNEEFLRKNHGDLIRKVKNVDGIVDDLDLTKEMAANVRAEKTDQAKMRKVLEYTNSKRAAKLLVDALYKHAEDVMEDLTTD